MALGKSCSELWFPHLTNGNNIPALSTSLGGLESPGIIAMRRLLSLMYGIINV